MLVNPKVDSPTDLPEGYIFRSDLRHAGTPQDLKTAPRHRWFSFPHSYSYRLVHQILEHWDLPEGATIADNFVGSGTTLVVAREQGLKALGYDISPLAVMVTNVKVGSYRTRQLNSILAQLLETNYLAPNQSDISHRLTRAFTDQELHEIFGLSIGVNSLNGKLHDFFLTSLISTAQRFSRAVADGGWFRWKSWPDRSMCFRSTFQSVATTMIEDVVNTNYSAKPGCQQASVADARKLPLTGQSLEGLITSPPYPNRHDYSRVFHIQLLLMGYSESDITALRYGSVRSHVEAKHQKGYEGRLGQYKFVPAFENILDMIAVRTDRRVATMLMGYFEDMFLSLQEVYRVLRDGGRAAYIVGNVRHSGVMIPVDEIIGQIAEQVGLTLDAVWVIRQRGNSAQQMGKFGRTPSRESVLFFSKAAHV